MSQLQRAALVLLLETFLAATAADAASRRVFLTSTLGSADLSTWAETDLDGLDGANAICQARADAETLGGTWRAWISTDATDAWCNVTGNSGLKPGCGGANPNPALFGPWLRMDGLPFSGTLAELTGPDHRVYHPPFFDETGAVADDDSPWVWTATDFDGVRSGTTCGDWSSMTGEALTGYAERSGREWTDFNDVDCEDDGYVHLLCFELGAGDPLDWERTPGHLVFLTSTDGTGNLGAWEEAGDATGGDAGDAICRARAAAAHLPRPDAFVAWLSDSGAGIDAVERVTAGGPFVRVDGFVFSPTEDALLGSAPDFDSSLNVTELETYLEAPFPGIRAWTGSTNQGVSDPDFDCSDWSSTAGQGAGGEVIAVGEDNWQNAGSPSCSSTHPLYCFSNVEILSWDNFERGDLHRWTSDSSGP